MAETGMSWTPVSAGRHPTDRKALGNDSVRAPSQACGGSHTFIRAILQELRRRPLEGPHQLESNRCVTPLAETQQSIHPPPQHHLSPSDCSPSFIPSINLDLSCAVGPLGLWYGVSVNAVNGVEGMNQRVVSVTLPMNRVGGDFSRSGAEFAKLGALQVMTQ